MKSSLYVRCWVPDYAVVAAKIGREYGTAIDTGYSPWVIGHKDENKLEDAHLAVLIEAFEDKIGHVVGLGPDDMERLYQYMDWRGYTVFTMTYAPFVVSTLEDGD